MKKIFSLIIGLIMIFAALVASGEPSSDATARQIIIVEAVCIAILFAGAFWLLRNFGNESREEW